MTAVTYESPHDDAEVFVYMGVKFFSGIPVELDPVENARLIAKASGNQHFAIDVDADGVTDAPKPKRGRPFRVAPVADDVTADKE